MTQALINSTDLIQSSGFIDNAVAAVSSAATTEEDGSDKTFLSAFSEILDKTLQLQDTVSQDEILLTDDGDMSIETPNLNEIIVQTLKEASVEKSLDLTLSKDIAATINSIKLASDPETETVSEEDVMEFSADTEKDCSVQLNIKPDNKKNEQDKDDKVVFEQVLTFINDNKISNNETKESASANQDTSFDDGVELVYKEKDYKIQETEKNDSTDEPALDEDMLNELNIESVSSDGANAESDSMANPESPEEFGVKVMLNHSVDKTESAFTKVLSQESAKPASMTPDKIIEQITKHMDSLKNNSGVKMVLNPESLGKLNLQIMNTKDGLSAQFTVTTNEARDLLMKGIDGLKESLLTQGIGVDNISVKVSETEESSYNPDWTEQENSENGKHGQQKQNREEKEKGLFEKTIAESLKNKNGKV